MPRATNAVQRHRRKKRLLKRTKGFWGGRSNLYRRAYETAIRADAFAFRDRRVRKRDFRSLWITRINAAARLHGMNYSSFINALQCANVTLSRKVLASIALDDADGFEELVAIAKKHQS